MCVAFAEDDKSGFFSAERLHAAYLACRRRKRKTSGALQWEMRQLDNLADLRSDLAQGCWQPSPMRVFSVGKPKMREIFAAPFRDRIVHHLLIAELEKIWEPVFIFDSHACRSGKGTHLAVERLARFLRILSGRRSSGAGYYLQLDVRSYFLSVDRRLLWDLLRKRLEKKKLELGDLAETLGELTGKIVLSNPISNALVSPSFRGKIPAHKSLFGQKPGKGLPIGNLTSQFFANVYLNELDQYLKRTEKVKHYVRYMDDFVILHPHRERLIELRDKIERFLGARLNLELKKKEEPKPVSGGVDFLGYVVHPNYRLVRGRVVSNLKEKLTRYLRSMYPLSQSDFREMPLHFRCPLLSQRRLRDVLASYSGHFRHADAWRLTLSLWRRFPALGWLFVPRAGKCPFFLAECARNQTFRQQVAWFERHYPTLIRFFRVGRYWEIYGRQSELLRPGVKPNGRRGNLPRFGFPAGSLSRYATGLETEGVPYCLITENGFSRSGLKIRAVTHIHTAQTECAPPPDWVNRVKEHNPKEALPPWITQKFLTRRSNA